MRVIGIIMSLAQSHWIQFLTHHRNANYHTGDITEHSKSSRATRFPTKVMMNLQRCFQAHNTTKPLQNPINRWDAEPVLYCFHLTINFLRPYFLLLLQATLLMAYIPAWPRLAVHSACLSKDLQNVASYMYYFLTDEIITVPSAFWMTKHFVLVCCIFIWDHCTWQSGQSMSKLKPSNMGAKC
jgi:hypothetical protein